jgi:hypothetical protein
MKGISDFQQKHLEAIHVFYKALKNNRRENLALSDVIISWFTEGHAEKFRQDYLKNNPVFS